MPEHPEEPANVRSWRPTAMPFQEDLDPTITPEDGGVTSEEGAFLEGVLSLLAKWPDGPGAPSVANVGDGAAPRVLKSDVPGRLNDTVAQGALEEILEAASDPRRANAKQVGMACLRLADWAESIEACRVSQKFLQATTRVNPTNPELALERGIVERQIRQPKQARGWLRHAARLSRLSGQERTYARAWLNLAISYMKSGNFKAARRHLERAEPIVRRLGEHEVWARVCHDRFVLEAQAGSAEAAERYMGRAVALYRQYDQNVVSLAHDIAFYMLNRGDYRGSHAVFRALYPRVERHRRPTILGSIARASGGLQDRETYHWACEKLARFRPHPRMAEAWLDAAEGARLLGMPESALAMAQRSEKLARESGEGAIQMKAEELVLGIQDERARGTQEAEGSESAVASEASVLSEALVHALATPNRDTVNTGAPQ